MTDVLIWHSNHALNYSMWQPLQISPLENWQKSLPRKARAVEAESITELSERKFLLQKTGPVQNSTNDWQMEAHHSLEARDEAAPSTAGVGKVWVPVALPSHTPWFPMHPSAPLFVKLGNDFPSLLVSRRNTKISSEP